MQIFKEAKPIEKHLVSIDQIMGGQADNFHVDIPEGIEESEAFYSKMLEQLERHTIEIQNVLTEEEFARYAPLFKEQKISDDVTFLTQVGQSDTEDLTKLMIEYSTRVNTHYPVRVVNEKGEQVLPTIVNLFIPNLKNLQHMIVETEDGPTTADVLMSNLQGLILRDDGLPNSQVSLKIRQTLAAIGEVLTQAQLNDPTYAVKVRQGREAIRNFENHKIMDQKRDEKGLPPSVDGSEDLEDVFSDDSI